MLLTVAVVVMIFVASVGLFGFRMMQDVTLVATWSGWALLVLACFVGKALNVCVEVNEQLNNDSDMLLNMQYFLRTDIHLYENGPNRKQHFANRELEKSEADKMLQILGQKID